MKLRTLSKIVICFAFVLATTRAFCLTADVTDISDNKYFEAVHQELARAKKSITVAMYLISTNLFTADSLQNILLSDLIAAKKRGLTVKVYLDKSARPPEKNDFAYDLLSQAGIDARFASPGLCLHDKLIIIDGKTVISGSTNWTYSALKINSENSDLIRSPEYAQIKLAKIARIKTIGIQPPKPAYSHCLKVPGSFLRDAKFASRIVNRSQATLFDLYLFLLKTGQDLGFSEFPVNYKDAALAIGRSPENPNTINKINKFLKKLAKDYKLIGAEFKYGAPTVIKLFPPAKESSFNIPYAYWDYGWDKKLSLPAKFIYLVNLYEQENSQVKPWWSLSRQRISDEFHISEVTVTNGMRELEKLQIVDVLRSKLVVKGRPFNYRHVNCYLLKPLPSPESVKQAWETLEASYGKEPAGLGRKLAAFIDEENDCQVVEKFIQLVDTYSYEWVEGAAKITAKLAVHNPSRNVYYVEGILKNWSDQGHMD